MSLVLLGVLIALALAGLGHNVPQFQKFPQIRWVLAILAPALTVAVSIIVGGRDGLPLILNTGPAGGSPGK